MANEGDILKGIMQLQDVKKRLKPHTAIRQMLKGQQSLAPQTVLPKIAKDPTKAELAVLHASQIGLQSLPFLLEAKPIQITESIVSHLLKRPLISVGGTVGTQFLIEKLKGKSNTKALWEGIKKGGVDAGVTYGAFKAKKLLNMEFLKRTRQKLKIFDKKMEGVYLKNADFFQKKGLIYSDVLKKASELHELFKLKIPIDWNKFINKEWGAGKTVVEQIFNTQNYDKLENKINGEPD